MLERSVAVVSIPSNDKKASVRSKEDEIDILRSCQQICVKAPRKLGCLMPQA